MFSSPSAEYRLSRVELGEAWHEEFDVERGTVVSSQQ